MKRPRTRRPGSADLRALPPGTPYACDDPYVGARVAVGKVAGRVVGCATPPAGKRGRYFAVGDVASGSAIGRAWKGSAARKAALATRYTGPDFDLRPPRRPRPGKGAGAPVAHKGLSAPPPRTLLGLPAPREEHVHHGEVVDLTPARRLPFEPPRAAPRPARRTPAPAPSRRAGALHAPAPDARPVPVATTPSRPRGVLAPSYLGLGVEFPRITVAAAPGLASIAFDLGDDLPGEVLRTLATTVRAAIEQSGFTMPLARGLRVVSSAPITSYANLALPIALALLEATGEVPAGALDGVLACGGLSFRGDLEEDRAIFLAVHHANEAGVAAAIIPGRATRAPSALGPMPLHAADTLREVVEALRRGGVGALSEARYRARYTPGDPRETMAVSLADPRVPENLRLPVALAAAGNMNLLLVNDSRVAGGNSSASTAARMMLSVLAPPSAEETVALTDMASLFGPVPTLVTEWPISAPFHSTQAKGFVGSRASTATGVMPGELARADLGVLVLDQLPEFPRETIEALREPLTEGTVTVLRTVKDKTRRVAFPSRLRLVASMAPCPCGRLRTGGCTCDAARIARWWDRVPSWLLERFDLVTDDDMAALADGGSPLSFWVERVARAREARAARGGDANAGTLRASGPALHAARHDAADRVALRRLRVARVLADMADEDVISEEHVHRALPYTFDPVRRYASGAAVPVYAPKAAPPAAPEGLAALLPGIDAALREELDKALAAHRREGHPRPSDKALNAAVRAPAPDVSFAQFPEALSLDWRGIWDGKRAPGATSRDRYFVRMDATLADRRRGTPEDLAASLRVMIGHLKGMLDAPGLGSMAHRLARKALARYFVEFAALLDARWAGGAR